jgi:hypothetical protein
MRLMTLADSGGLVFQRKRRLLLLRLNQLTQRGFIIVFECVQDQKDANRTSMSCVAMVSCFLSIRFFCI